MRCRNSLASLLLPALILLINLPGGRPAAESQADAKEEILALEQEWYQAFWWKDAPKFDPLEADELVFMACGYKAPVNKAEQLRRALLLKRLSIVTRSLEAPTVRFFGDVAVVTGLQTVTERDDVDRVRVEETM